MIDLLVQALREDEALATNNEWRVRICNIAAHRIEELEARLKQAEDRLKKYDLGMMKIRQWIETGEIQT